jgi:hypothetical protein
MTILWQHEGYRHIMRTITAAWGIGFLIEAALRVLVVCNSSTGTALAITDVSPFAFAGILSAWTIAYATHHKKKGERIAPAAGVPQPPSTEITQAADTKS